ncbi:Chromosome partition protein Smc [Caballeronia temeraria]|uniref:Chromosome partition protein Smc n=2 Tax=Caballeronia TaxID=1827195 RepID=A0A158D7G4_9BURK|nr:MULTISPECIES: hypothetical protein [Caballeronia]SAK57501.1 Chromosome partition protein Smc [Caballeronia temeraria]SAK90290.1 Chromosome partition protein Smc [Caballeronia catudaia]
MPNGETSKNTQLSKVQHPLLNPPGEFNDALDDIFTKHDPKWSYRDTIARAVKKALGDDPAFEELAVQIIESLMAVAEARARIKADLETIGAHLLNTMYSLKNVMIAKAGDTIAIKRKAASLGFVIFDSALGLKRSVARQYMRCYEAFADNAEAIRTFNVGELDILAAEHVTDEQVAEILAKKKEDPDMTRMDVKRMLVELQKKDAALEDGRIQLLNVHSQLQDAKTALSVSESEAKHLRTELAASARKISDREADLARMDDHYKRKQAGLSNMEKDLADKDKEIGRLTREANELRNRKPDVQYVDKPTAPAGYTSIAESIQKSNDELAEIEKRIAAEQAALEALEAERKKQAAAIEAANKVQASLQDVSASFEVFAAKLMGAQLAVQACETPAQHEPLLEALAAMLRKTVSELDAALGR